ncbi:hypothetical protein A7D17_19160 [Xanthomonas floridensis]|uniref:Uncharacterized protein n=1 Tax=Xanthomonas floridensis TaxID=1843580 RepID=A0A1A9M9B3_9XANT|nr:hypothetical protein A7D17_19160 [Xanthomonas floridensis]
MRARDINACNATHAANALAHLRVIHRRALPVSLAAQPAGSCDASTYRNYKQALPQIALHPIAAPPISRR